MIKEYDRTFGHEVEDLVADFLEGLDCVKAVYDPTEEEDQDGKVDLWVDFADGCGELGLQITTASNPQVLARKERELQVWHQTVVLVQVPGREVNSSLRSGQLTRTAGAAVVHQLWQGLNPARQRVLAGIER
ncbi:hypothetical protein CL633_03650 [bacterium]|nr:hypothetical protein [bacterium]